MKECIVCGLVQKNRLKRGMCSKHYYQYRKYGKVIDNNKRHRKTLNEIIESESIAEIILYNNEGLEKARTIIDAKDIEKVKKFKWMLDTKGYVTNSRNRIFLHRLITSATDGILVDHKNGNPLDNRKSNLRMCNHSQNNMNRKIGSRNTSGINGVCWAESSKKWLAQINMQGEHKYLGTYDNIEDAKKVREKAEKEYFGEFRRRV